MSKDLAKELISKLEDEAYSTSDHMFEFNPTKKIIDAFFKSNPNATNTCVHTYYIEDGEVCTDCGDEYNWDVYDEAALPFANYCPNCGKSITFEEKG